jgi:hypothetical protein
MEEFNQGSPDAGASVLRGDGHAETWDREALVPAPEEAICDHRAICEEAEEQIRALVATHARGVVP